ncbi:MAG: DNA polymerase III subunit delta' [Armatimonadia bacterium]
MFKDIIGHQAPLRALRRAIHSGRIPNAYLFVGPPKVGKTTAALQFAKALNCERNGRAQGSTPTAEEIDCCDECDTCRKFDQLNHADLMVLLPRTSDTKKKGDGDEEAAPAAGEEEKPLDIEGTMITTGQVERLVEHASLKPSRARYKVYIITAAETMNPSAANRLLKTLEEPPPQTLLILTASNLGALLPTIISRCQTLNFRPTTTQELEQRLLERFPGADPAQVHTLASLSGGRPGWAISMLQCPDIFELRTRLLDQCVQLPGMPMVRCLALGEILVEAAEAWWLATNDPEVGEKALKSYRDRVLRTRMNEVLDLFTSWFRDLMVTIGDPNSPLIVNADRREDLQRIAPRYTLQACQRVCGYLEEMKRQLRQNANLRLAAEMAALRMLSAAPTGEAK